MAENDDTAGFAPHPLRRALLGELHARPFLPVETPRTFLHYGFTTDDEAAAVDRAWFAEFCRAHGSAGPNAETRHHVLAFGGGALRWESHAEFTTYTWDGTASARTGTPFADEPDGSPFGRDFRAPGPLIVATRLDLIDADQGCNFDALFDPASLAASEIVGGGLIAATDFRPDGHGLTRILVINRGEAPQAVGAACQRLLEVETYRLLALMGLPEAQRQAPQIRRIETGLSEIADEIRTSAGLDANEALLQRLTQLAADLEAGAAASAYRFGASRAYDEIITQRLAALGERALAGRSTWASFLARRLRPAMRTCETTEERQANLSRKLARAATLLRTRVDVELESQNRNLLEAMNRRARLQLRLQQTVEGLSVAAISYYVVGLLGHLFEGAEKAGVPLSTGLAQAISVPVVVLMIWYLVRRIRAHHSDLE
ncbi:putative membrane-anchored protein [Breoghania corrubedonensis]|uniref:Putative membrane-anchored protein n=1 Tax=Breoghania corrubedonensis TaxID=665038 RepID=A0A2T5VF39_9HYPH|nr:DUF3422 domain-containing protein [Breoghania corrubedonensis]PTW62367.1 putative membrane-anchored protein [Breoghania corrubedonensis]